MLKKSYKGFILWMLGFVALAAAVSFLSIEDEALLVRIINNLCAIGIEILMLLIYKTENVFCDCPAAAFTLGV